MVVVRSITPGTLSPSTGSFLRFSGHKSCSIELSNDAMRPATDYPFLSGNYAPVHDETIITDLAVLGALPRALSGQYLRIGPNPMGCTPVSHDWTTAEGMVHAITLRSGRALSYRNRWIRTDGAARKLGLEPVPGPGPSIRDSFLHLSTS